MQRFTQGVDIATHASTPRLTLEVHNTSRGSRSPPRHKNFPVNGAGVVISKQCSSLWERVVRLDPHIFLVELTQLPKKSGAMFLPLVPKSHQSQERNQVLLQNNTPVLYRARSISSPPFQTLTLVRGVCHVAFG